LPTRNGKIATHVGYVVKFFEVLTETTIELRPLQQLEILVGNITFERIASSWQPQDAAFRFLSGKHCKQPLYLHSLFYYAQNGATQLFVLWSYQNIFSGSCVSIKTSLATE